MVEPVDPERKLYRWKSEVMFVSSESRRGWERRNPESRPRRCLHRKVEGVSNRMRVKTVFWQSTREPRSLPTSGRKQVHLHFTHKFLFSGCCPSERHSSVGTHYSPPKPPTGMPGSTIHGSVPCSSWEMTSGLETWSPAHGRRKERGTVCRQGKPPRQNPVSQPRFRGEAVRERSNGNEQQIQL